MDHKVTTPPNLCANLQRAAEVAGRGLRVMSEARVGEAERGEIRDPLKLQDAGARLAASLVSDPLRIAGMQFDLWTNYQRLVHTTMLRSLGVESAPVAAPAADDRRFRDQDWSALPLFDFLKQAYLLNSQAWVELVAGADLDQDTRERLDFVTRQMVDALSPSNFAATNPQALREMLESGGRSAIEGLGNLIEDCERNPGKLDVSMCDRDSFTVGADLAVTPGKVVFRNQLIELIQYQPTTEKVFRRPLLVMPPWMNKFYVMDLRPGNSMVQWLVDQGHTVFMISWANPDADFAGKGFEDYMLEGPLAALDAIERATGQREVNAVGYCLGGILLAATMGWMAARGDDRVRSATYLTTMVDFSDVGEVGLFIDRDSLADLERSIHEVGYLDGRKVAATWRAVRANDLVWSFFVNNYLLGRKPMPLDLLYWNSDSTHLTAACHCFVMREFYLENRLREPGGVTLAGTPVDVTRVKTPAYILAAREDHIAPWKTAYVSNHLFAGPRRFVLGESGHIAGVINPPARGKYGYWTSRERPADPDQWLEGAKAHQGSWWPDWQRWVRRYSGGQVAARDPGAGGLAALADAPGTYVHVRVEDL